MKKVWFGLAAIPVVLLVILLSSMPSHASTLDKFEKKLAHAQNDKELLEVLEEFTVTAEYQNACRDVNNELISIEGKLTEENKEKYVEKLAELNRIFDGLYCILTHEKWNN